MKNAISISVITIFVIIASVLMLDVFKQQNESLEVFYDQVMTDQATTLKSELDSSISDLHSEIESMQSIVNDYKDLGLDTNLDLSDLEDIEGFDFDYEEVLSYLSD